jgi:beta-phosphoglucomutase-like phosphatase (HAD superfamily)
MDGVLCNSEEPSRRAAVSVFAEMGVDVTVEDFIPFGGTGDSSTGLLPVLADRKCSIPLSFVTNSSSRPLHNCNSSTAFTVTY